MTQSESAFWAAQLAAYNRGEQPKLRRPRSRSLNSSSEPWTAGEERRLCELAGKVQRDEIARILTAEFHVPRTVVAVCIRARKLGLSLWWEGWPQHKIAEAFGVTCNTVAKWGRDGLLRYRIWEGGGRGRGRWKLGQWHVEKADLYEFIDHHPWAYDLERMPAGPLRTRAEVAHRADRWLTAQEAADAMGISRELLGYYARAGLVPHKRRVAGAGQPKIMVRATDIPGLRKQLREQAVQHIGDAVRKHHAQARQRVAELTPVLRFVWRDGRHVPVRLVDAA